MKLPRFLTAEWPGLVLPMVPLLLFSQVLLGPWVFWQRDISLYWYPQAEAFVRVVSGGSLPLWNPYMSFGLPLLADPSFQALYPFTWLNLILLPDTFYKIYALFHVSAAGVGVYFLVRRWGYSRLSAFAAGGTWMASGPLLVVVSHYHHLAGTAWLPWVLLALHVALASGTVRASVILGATAAGQLLAGSGDLCLMSAFAAAGYIAVFLAGGNGDLSGRVRATATTVIIAGPSAAFLSAVQWLPTVAILGTGQRLQLDPNVRTYWSLHPASLLDLLVPRLVNDMPVNPAWRAALFEAREPLFACVYVGAAAVAMVTLSLTFRWNRFKAFAFGGFSFSMLTALGRHTVLYPLLVRTTPLFLFRFPEKYVMLAGFFWALLVGTAFEDWTERRGTGESRPWVLASGLAGALAVVMLGATVWTLGGPGVLLRAVEPIGVVARERFLVDAAEKWLRAGAAVALVALLGWLRGRRQERATWAAGAALGLVLVDLGSVGWQINPAAPPQLMKARPALLSRVEPGSRVWVSLSNSREWLNQQVVRGQAGWDWRWWWVAGLRDMLWPPTSARWGLYGSYDEDFTGLAPPLGTNLNLILQHAIGSPLGRRILQIGGVDYVVGLDAWPSLEPVAALQSSFAQPIQVYRVPETRPRTYVVQHARVAAEPRSVTLLGDASFDPKTEIVVQQGASELPAAEAPPTALRELWRRADSIGVEVEAAAPAYVVALQSFYAGWRARVDDRPTEIVRANVLFQAVRVEPGRHQVVLEYRPAAVLWGAVLSSVSAVFALVLCGPWRRPGLGLPHVGTPQ